MPPAATVHVRPSAPSILGIGHSPQGTQSVSNHALRQLLDLTVTSRFIDAAALDLPAAGLDLNDYPPRVQQFIHDVTDADAIILGCGIHRSATAGYFRNSLELLRGTLTAKPTLLIVAAGSTRAHLATEAAVADLLMNFDADVVRKPIVCTDTTPPAELLDRLQVGLDSLLAKVPVSR